MVFPGGTFIGRLPWDRLNFLKILLIYYKRGIFLVYVIKFKCIIPTYTFLLDVGKFSNASTCWIFWFISDMVCPMFIPPLWAYGVWLTFCLYSQYYVLHNILLEFPSFFCRICCRYSYPQLFFSTLYLFVKFSISLCKEGHCFI